MLEVQPLREYSVQDEPALVRRVQQGDKEAFADLYESYFDKVYRYLTLKTGSRVEATVDPEPTGSGPAETDDEADLSPARPRQR